MDSATQLQLVVLFILLILSAFFSASETALNSISKIRIRSMVDDGVKNAELIKKVTDNPNKLISSILVGNNLVNIGASALATSLAIDLFGNNVVGFVTGLLTILVLIFGEITPKTFATQNAEKVCSFVVKPIAFCMFIFTPIVVVLNFITGLLFKVMRFDANKKNPIITESELITMVNVSHEEGVLEVDEREMINNVVDFGNSDAKDVMTPRTDVIAIPETASYKEIENMFREEQFSRIPVYRDSMDNIIGTISFKDFMFSSNSNNFDINSVLREPYFTYESKPCIELFSIMRTKRISMAVVLDEYGGTSGLVTLEDLLEEIVGDIADEYDDENEEEIKIVVDDSEFLVDGSTKIDDVNEAIGTDFESDDFDSIGGYVVGVIGRFPERGETIEDRNIKFVIEEIDKNRIAKMRIFKEIQNSNAS